LNGGLVALHKLKRDKNSNHTKLGAYLQGIDFMGRRFHAGSLLVLLYSLCKISLFCIRPYFVRFCDVHAQARDLPGAAAIA